MSSDAGVGTERAVSPPGLYPDSLGVVRWWDGRAWDMTRRSPGQEHLWAILGHLSLLTMLMFPALVLRVTVGRQDRFTRHHTTEALNAQIWFVVIWNGLLLPLFLTSKNGGETPVWAYFGMPLAFAAYLITAGLAIFGAVQASRGSWWRYPLPFRVVSGSVRKNDRPG
jgi:uncharacterized Tic20 family protein